VRAGDRRVGELDDARDAQRLGRRACAAQPGGVGALAPRRPPAVAERGRGDHTAHEHPVALERDQARPDRDPAREVPGPVDRVEDPARGRVACLAAALLLAEHRLAGPLGGEPLAQRPLDGTIGVGHRTQVGLALDAQVGRAEPRQRERVGKVGELEREGEIRAHALSVRATPCRRRP
jgi:hypothetical protein